MAGHSRPKDGVASLAYVPAIHVFSYRTVEDVDAQHKAGHDGIHSRSAPARNSMTIISVTASKARCPRLPLSTFSAALSGISRITLLLRHTLSAPIGSPAPIRA